jgi:hypothetical protein
MPNDNPEIKAIIVTKANASLLSIISGMDERTFTANIGWVLVEDWNHRKRFNLMPKASFKAAYPKAVPTATLLDN